MWMGKRGGRILFSSGQTRKNSEKTRLLKGRCPFFERGAANSSYSKLCTSQT